MVDARDAMLAADLLRFGGANQDLLWNAFAKRGLGEGATSDGTGDVDPVPSFASPFANEATVRFRPVDGGGGPIADAELFVGDYQARAVPVADTDAATPLDRRGQPGARARTSSSSGRPATATSGSARSRSGPGRRATCRCAMRPNLASGRGGRHRHRRRHQPGQGRSTTTRRRTGPRSAAPVAGKQVTVDLAGGAPAGPPGAGQRACCGRRSPATPDARRAEPVLRAAAVPGPRRAPRRATVTCAERGRLPARLHQPGRTRSRRSRRGRGRRS